MKAKMKFDLGSIKNWLLAHGEKVALGVVALVFLMFVYSALQRETLEATYEPEKMTQLASQVGDHVRNSKWDQTREAIKVVNYAERAKPKVIPVGAYKLPIAFDKPVTDPKAKRGEPEILPPEELRVAAGMDILEVKDAAAGGPDQKGQGVGLKAQPWAVITGLVPIERHRQAFASVFAEAMEFTASRDTPTYLQPLLERAEVNPANPDQLTWTKLSEAATTATSPSRDEIVSAKFVVPGVTAPLGQLVRGGQWGEAVSHPKIPLIGESAEAAKKPAAPAQPVPPNGKNPPAAASPAPATEETVQHVLLRAFDYSAEPGKKYRYRVTLVLTNPNAGLSPQFLADPASAAISTLQSAATAATPVVTIPDGHDVLAGTIIDAGSLRREPTAKILVTSIDRKTGMKAATEIDAHRGTVANTPPREVIAIHPIDKQKVKLNLGFESNILVLDIYGGNDLGTRRKEIPITEPGEILLLDSNGNMTVRSEIDDFDQYQDTLVREEAPAQKRALDDDKEKERKQIQSRKSPR